jgi:hypothetical protein
MHARKGTDAIARASNAAADKVNGAIKNREPVYVDLLDDSGQPTAYLRNAPFLNYNSPMTALERCFPAITGLNRLDCGWVSCMVAVPERCDWLPMVCCRCRSCV